MVWFEIVQMVWQNLDNNLNNSKQQQTKKTIAN